MARPVSSEQVRHLRLRAQRLHPRTTAGGAGPLVQVLGGVQAQDPFAAALVLRARCDGLTAAGVEQARVVERVLVRTWALRGTLHLVGAEEAGWMPALLGPVFVAASGRRYRELGLDEDACSRAMGAIRALLAHGPMTRAEIVEALNTRGLRATGQAGYHLLRRAALEGILCMGPDRAAEPTYVLLDDWIGRRRPLPREAAAAELVRRYLAAHAPAGPEDFTAWSGLPLGAARAAWRRIADELVEAAMPGGSAWLLAEQAARVDEAATAPPAPVVRLLPGFDPYLLGYRRRDFAVAPHHARRINAGGGMIRPVLLVDGRVAGTCAYRRGTGALHVTVEPFEALDGAVLQGIEAERADLARFLGHPVSLQAGEPA